MNSNRFFTVLFDEGEQTCFGKSLYTVTLDRVPFLDFELGIIRNYNIADTPFFSINPMHTKRADANVTVYRNILIEFDALEPEQQLELLKHVPYSTLVWSGGKSFHAIISLEQPCSTREEYNQLVRRIQTKLPDMDISTSNPSRFSRSPDVMRDNGQLQELIEVRQRISPAELLSWLGPAAPEPVYAFPEPFQGYIPPWTRSYLRLGSEPGQRNRDAFKAACDLARADIDEFSAAVMIAEVADLDLHEVNSCVSSAYKTVRGSK